MAIPRPCAVIALGISLVHSLSLTLAWHSTSEKQSLELQLGGNFLRLGVDAAAVALAFSVSTEGKF